MKLKNWTICIFVVLTLVCGSEQQAKKDIPKKANMENGFSLKSLDNQTYTLSQLKGKVVLIDFWATWCAPCKRSIPTFIKLYKKYKDRGFIVLGIGLDNEQALRNYQTETNIPYPILLGTKETAKLYNIRAIPTMIIYDKNGKFVKTQVGFSPELEDILDTLIDSLLNQ